MKRRNRRNLTRHLNELGEFSADHLANIAKNAVLRAKIPFDKMSFEDQISSAYFGIAKGLENFQPGAWQSSRVWLSMQAYFQLKNDFKRAVQNRQREMPIIEETSANSAELPPLDMSILDEDRERFYRAFNRLSKRQQKIVWASAVNGEHFSHIAAQMNLSRTLVIREYRKAVSALHRYLSRDRNGSAHKK